MGRYGLVVSNGKVLVHMILNLRGDCKGEEMSGSNSSSNSNGRNGKWESINSSTVVIVMVEIVRVGK